MSTGKRSGRAAAEPLGLPPAKLRTKKMNGICDVQGCEQTAFLCWRLMSENRGKQICETHWLRHNDSADTFDLFHAFGLRRPANIHGLLIKHARPEQSTRLQQQQAGQTESGRCRACGAERKAGHIYCEKCSRERKAESNRQRRRRCYEKKKSVALLSSRRGVS